ncbi:unnamed protein product [Ranitomeya imitator]|uniref:Uncharacterized protein n=1 Tax=Ranitomeya imitator TaxID=111125 RepID=A0ABN9M155_9NEOB|nr:unnamed protein product [Ranitomeya imitator]
MGFPGSHRTSLGWDFLEATTPAWDGSHITRPPYTPCDPAQPALLISPQHHCAMCLHSPMCGLSTEVVPDVLAVCSYMDDFPALHHCAGICQISKALTKES